MSIAARKCLDAVAASTWDTDNCVATLRGIIRGKTPAKHPRKAVLEYIDSAREALAEARVAALKLPKGGQS